MYREGAIIRIAPGGIPLLRVTMGPWPPTRRSPRPGRRTPTAGPAMRLAVESPRHACWQLMRLGASVEVLDPPELRATMIRTIPDLSALYGKP